MCKYKWFHEPIENIVEEIIDHRGKTPKKLSMEWGNGNILALSANNVQMGKINTSLEANYGNEKLYQKWMRNNELSFGDVLMTMEAPLGNVAQVPDNDKYILSQRVIAFKTKEYIDNKYFKYYLTSSQFQNMLYRYSSGTTAKGISQKNLKPLLVSFPTLHVQQKIAAILSSVDDTINKTEQLIKQTERLKQGLIRQLLTKGIEHTKFKQTGIGEIPKNWESSSFKSVFDRVTTKNKDKTENVLTISGEKGLVNQLDYFNKKVSSKNLSDYIYLEKGDFAYNKSYSNGYPLGAIKMLENYDCGIVSTLYICFRLKPPYDIDFYKYYFDSSLWNKQVHNIAPEGGRSHGLLNVGVKDFFEISIPVPPVEEQQSIGKIIKSIDQKLAIERSKNAKLKKIKYGLMQQLLTGKVRVPAGENEVMSQ